MTKEARELDEDELNTSDLPITLYLNQRLTFDLLAILEGGFTSFSTVQTTSSGENSTNIDGSAQLGISNIFAFLGIKLSADKSKFSGSQSSENETKEIVHTPTSLFARLRKQLHDQNLVKSFDNSADITGFNPGEFIEFRATLRKSPLVDVVESFSALLPLTALADDNSPQTSNQSHKKRGNQRNRNVSGKNNEISVMKSQIDLIRSAIISGSSQDLIAETDSLRIVLATEHGYFVDPSMNDIIDGTFRVFGKTTRVVCEHSDSISLLRKTALGKFGNIVEQLGTAMQGLQDVGFSEPIETKINGPTMQVIPLAIFS